MNRETFASLQSLTLEWICSFIIIVFEIWAIHHSSNHLIFASFILSNLISSFTSFIPSLLYLLNPIMLLKIGALTFISNNGLIYIYVWFVGLEIRLNERDLEIGHTAIASLPWKGREICPSPMIKTLYSSPLSMIEPLELLLCCGFAPRFIVADPSFAPIHHFFIM